jgi:hypothetical protein
MRRSIVRLSLELRLPLVFLSALSGCSHYQYVLPGMLDMRTDGNAGTPSSVKQPSGPTSRTGTQVYVDGEGVRVTGSDVSIQDRHYFLLGVFPIYNDDPRSELNAAVGLADAIVDVQVGEEMTTTDVVGGMIVRTVFPMASWITPSWTFLAKGKLVRDPNSTPSEADTDRPRLDADQEPSDVFRDTPPPPPLTERPSSARGAT